MKRLVEGTVSSFVHLRALSLSNYVSKVVQKKHLFNVEEKRPDTDFRDQIAE